MGEKCVVDKFGKNGISFRPGVMAGIERVEAFGSVIEFNRLPFWEKEQVRNFYKKIIPDVFAASELAQDSLNFVEGGDKFHCAKHSKKEDGEMGDMMRMLMENMDYIILAAMSFMAIFVVYTMMRCCVKGN